ncbi:hypothetical protein GCM10010271_31800 [Streptomyces kurssanovii]|nr:hypothetical protein GCM10010271_31800 [Streptomyces kurssanovii]
MAAGNSVRAVGRRASRRDPAQRRLGMSAPVASVLVPVGGQVAVRHCESAPIRDKLRLVKRSGNV